MTKQTILVVDASPLIYSVYNTQGHLKTSTGIITGLRYGFLRSIRSYQNKCKADAVAICFDLPGAVRKAEGREEYKSNRPLTEAKKDMWSQVDELREMLALTKWAQLDAEGFEADDLIGAVARAKAAHGHRVLIVTPDNDMAQLVSENVNIFYPKETKKANQFKGPDGVKEQFGVRPDQLLAYRAFCGDKSDNLDGLIRGEAERKRLAECFDRIKTFREPEQLFDAAVEDPNVAVEEGMRDAFLANVKIMDLPSPDEIRVRKGAKDKAALTTLFETLEFKSMMKFIPELVGEET